MIIRHYQLKKILYKHFRSYKNILRASSTCTTTFKVIIVQKKKNPVTFQMHTPTHKHSCHTAHRCSTNITYSGVRYVTSAFPPPPAMYTASMTFNSEANYVSRLENVSTNPLRFGSKFWYWKLSLESLCSEAWDNHSPSALALLHSIHSTQYIPT